MPENEARRNVNRRHARQARKMEYKGDMIVLVMDENEDAADDMMCRQF